MSQVWLAVRVILWAFSLFLSIYLSYMMVRDGRDELRWSTRHIIYKDELSSSLNFTLALIFGLVPVLPMLPVFGILSLWNLVPPLMVCMSTFAVWVRVHFHTREYYRQFYQRHLRYSGLTGEIRNQTYYDNKYRAAGRLAVFYGEVHKDVLIEALADGSEFAVGYTLEALRRVRRPVELDLLVRGYLKRRSEKSSDRILGRIELYGVQAVKPILAAITKQRDSDKLLQRTAKPDPASVGPLLRILSVYDPESYEQFRFPQ